MRSAEGRVPPQLDIVVVNWNAGGLLRDCVASVADADTTDRPLHLVIVDNDSSDGSLEGLPFGNLSHRVIRSGENVGFAAACNRGAAEGEAPYVLFLNPDTRISAAVLDHALTFMHEEQHRNVGICGVQLVDDTGCVTRSCSRHPTPGRMLGALIALDRVMPSLLAPHMMQEWDHAESRRVDQVIGAFFLVRRPLFERLGGFDEQFFVYYEEVDFALRAAASGMPTFYLAGAPAYHAGGGTTDGIRAIRQFLLVRSRILYTFKHFSVLAAVLHLAGALLVEPLVRTLHFAFGGKPADARESVRSWRMLWQWLPRFLVGYPRRRSGGAHWQTVTRDIPPG